MADQSPDALREKAFRERLVPLLSRVFGLCRGHGIGAAMVFEINPGRFSVSLHGTPGTSPPMRRLIEDVDRWSEDEDTTFISEQEPPDPVYSDG